MVFCGYSFPGPFWNCLAAVYSATEELGLECDGKSMTAIGKFFQIWIWKMFPMWIDLKKNYFRNWMGVIQSLSAHSTGGHLLTCWEFMCDASETVEEPAWLFYSWLCSFEGFSSADHIFICLWCRHMKAMSHHHCYWCYCISIVARFYCVISFVLLILLLIDNMTLAFTAKSDNAERDHCLSGRLPAIPGFQF